jgi:alkaline phosphatase
MAARGRSGLSMEMQRRSRRRRSRRKARKKQIVFLGVLALAIGIFVWTRILIARHDDETLLGATNIAIATPSTRDATVKPTAPTATKNMILFIGTGYGIVPMTATRIYAVGEDGMLAVDKLNETALIRTTSRNAQTADSAAAMSAYMTGVKVDNEVISQSSDTRPYDEASRPMAAHGETACPSIGNGKPAVTLLELAKAAGRATGIVTTARVTQAITAASFAHLCQRDGENTIASQLVPEGNGSNAKLGDGIDVILGGGWQHFLPKEDPRGSSRNDTRDLFAEMRAKGYAVIGRASELAATNQPIGKLLGLFNRSQLNYDFDRVGTTEPSLAEMTNRAIDLLQRNANGYLLIVEGGRIANAMDSSLARRALQEGRAFDDAIAVALDKIKELDPDFRNTTVVVTADHDHTMVMNGNATPAGRTIEARPGILGLLRNYNDPTQAANDASGRPFTTLVFGTGEKRIKGARSTAPPLTDLGMADKNLQYEAAVDVPSAIGGADVMLSATGANAAHFHGALDNTEVFTLMREAMGL